MSSRRWDYADNNTKFIGPVHRNFAENIWKTFKKGDFVSIGKTGKDEIGEITLTRGSDEEFVL